ncbi:ankyrin repeat-containing domain protein [Hysterangium stoloniferum]|nr:ankyrin repeat-containing domain protein [Hysterangium stoloniferum]
MSDSQEGASSNEVARAAARSDDEELLLQVLHHPDDKFDINFRDGLGNTALHYAAQHGSPFVLEQLLCCEGCDVDLQNWIEGNTPLHAAVKNIKDPELRNHIVGSLLDAGADTEVKDKHGEIVIDLITSRSENLDEELRKAIRQAKGEASILQNDIASDDGDDDGGSGSVSEDD